MVAVSRKLSTPRVPNFIMFEQPVGRRSEGFKPGDKISIADLTDEQLRAIGAEWTSNLVARAAAIRADR
jgi:hypothetical protein